MRSFLASLLGFGALAALLPVAACDQSAGNKGSSGTSGATPGADGGDADAGAAFDTGESLTVPVGTSRVYVKLASPPAVVTPGDPKTDKGWDLAFEGLDVYTNSGPSGSGGGQGFGPLDPVSFLDDTAPDVPFLTADTTGGAFYRWWFYDGTNHALFSRYHVYGVKDGDKLYKVQVLDYYGERDGAPVSALYHLRWQDVSPGATGALQDVSLLDGTAGGPTGTADAPSECLDLGTGARVMHSPDEARAASDWHLCFRRENISVNGELGGPRNAGAVDLDADKTATDSLADLANRSADSEKPRFDGIAATSFDGQTFRGDRIISAFSGLWIQPGSSPPAPKQMAWLVVGADGDSKYLVGFAKFDGATATSPGTVTMKVKSVK